MSMNNLTPGPKGILEHSQYIESVRKWYQIQNTCPPPGGSDAYPGAAYARFIGTVPVETFSWVNYHQSRKIYVPAHCVDRILLLTGPHAETLFKAYCFKHGLDVPKLADSAVV